MLFSQNGHHETTKYSAANLKYRVKLHDKNSTLSSTPGREDLTVHTDVDNRFCELNLTSVDPTREERRSPESLREQT